MWKLIPTLLLISACSNVIKMPAPVAYPSSCPDGDAKCQRNLDAQTLAYIGHPVAATKLMCGDDDLNRIMGDQVCGIY